MSSNRNLRERLGATALLLALVSVAAGVANAQGDAAALERGEKLFELCSTCHGDTAAGNQQFHAPAIAGMPEWYVNNQLAEFRDGRRGTHFDDLTGMRMRPMALTLRVDDDIRAVAKYVSSLPQTKPDAVIAGGDATAGAKIYGETCKSCHGDNGVGNEAMLGSAPLANTSDWYLYTQIEKFRAGTRGTKKGDQAGPLMRPMVMALSGDQAIKDVVAHIMTLSK